MENCISLKEGRALYFSKIRVVWVQWLWLSFKTTMCLHIRIVLAQLVSVVLLTLWMAKFFLSFSHRIPWKNINVVYSLQTSALVPEIFKFKNCVKYANETTWQVIHSTHWVYKQSYLGQFEKVANNSTGNTPMAKKIPFSRQLTLFLSHPHDFNMSLRNHYNFFKSRINSFPWFYTVNPIDHLLGCRNGPSISQVLGLWDCDAFYTWF